jgi:hypothetical protein
MPLWFQARDGEPLTDQRFDRPLCRPGETAPVSAWTVITDDAGKARDAVEAGATAVLVPLAGNLDAAGRMAIALSVIEAEQGLGDGDLALMAFVSGPGAALALAKGDLLPQRTLALGIDRAALLAASGEAGAASAAGLVALTAAARGIVSFVANGAAAENSQAMWNQFALRLVASDNPPDGKNRSKP